MLDDIFSLADVNMGFDPHRSGSTADANLIWMGMDPDISDLDIDQLAVPSEDDSSSLDQDSESDTDDDANIPKLHPAMMSLSTNDDIDNITERVPHAADLDEEVFAGSATDLPEVVKRLQERLLASYTSSNHPPINDSRDRSLAPSEVLSLKHYVAWVDSHGTVKAYSFHAKVLKDASNTEILSLYSVGKLTIELTELLVQLVDMCPKSCMAFTGEFKDLHSCNHIWDKHRGP